MPLVYSKTKRGISLKVLPMLQTTENLCECDMIMTIFVVVDLYSRAADRKQQVCAGLSAVFEATQPPRQQLRRPPAVPGAAQSPGTPAPPPAVPGAQQPPGIHNKGIQTQARHKITPTIWT